ncbi:hypothetical protein F5984_18650 [Rudanella paleaurantiibacter]|uniref:Uncharacterized protein n=1 Tax=Rudanella paleaurantiibacter TaxID=2614655 RepID=A0A7J5TVS4_9BACT|nr:hypothetical protein [Rudanella paleaurantiibacter]KAB7728393.1 hypothetical protein F5984_18650 [Rudanella paleaurantiibacter]
MLSFKLFSFPPGQDFVPSKETKNFWLYTKKSKRTFGGVVLPGLFETIGYPTQMIAFFAILVLEIIPTIYGIDQGVMWEAIAAAIFIDIFLAVVSHAWHDRICRHQNELVNADNEVLKEDLRRKISKYTLYTNFFYVVIIASGIMKFYFFYDAYMTPDAIAGAVLVCYLLASILHVAYTGYFLYTSRFNYKIQSEYSRYVSSGGQRFKDSTGTIQQPLFINGSTPQVKPIQVSAGNHHIYPKDENHFVIETTGVLTDRELADLIVKQPFDIQGLIARKGLQRQMEILQTS